MLQKNQIVIIKIEGVTFAGFGVSHYSDSELKNFAIFVPNTVERDVVSVKLVKIQKNYAYGKIEEILVPSSARIEPKCSVFDRCGGCSYLNTEYSQELKYKTQIVADRFRKEQYSFPEIQPCEPSPKTEFYRNKVIYPISSNGKFGFYARNSHRCIENIDCIQQYEEFRKVLLSAEKFIRKFTIVPYDESDHSGLFRNLFIRRSDSTNEICVCAVINSKKFPFEKEFAEEMLKIDGVESVYVNFNQTCGNELLGKEFRHIGGKEKITERLCSTEFKISPAAFFQINKYQTENLYSYALDIADISENDTVLDLYCGIGTITLVAAKKYKAGKYIGIEIVPQAISDAKENAVLNRISNAVFYCADSTSVTETLKKHNLPSPTVIIADPPRKGLGQIAVNAMIDLSPERIVYISCNPDTQAADLRAFIASGYNINSIKPFDMFPRTQHVETVCLLSKLKNQRHITG